MNKWRTIWFLLFLFVPLKLLSQDTLKVVEDYINSGQFLNDVIQADSATYKRGNTVYVLRKGGIYAWNASINVRGGRLEFRTDYGAGNPAQYPDKHFDPIIYFYPTTGGGGAPPGQMVSLIGDNIRFKMTHVMVTCYNEAQNLPNGSPDSLLPYANTGFMRTTSAGGSGVKIILDSCIVKTIAGQIIRTEAPVGLVKTTNCIFADMGHPTSNFGAGKFIDGRNVKIDTMWVTNNTFVNLYDRVIRHFQATAANYIGNFIFDHNTVVSSMSYHGFLSLGTVDNSGAGTFKITNNLLLDHFALGIDTANVRQVEFSDPAENDVWGRPRLAWVLTNANTAVQWDIRNNFYGVSDSGQAMLDLAANKAVFSGPYYRSVDRDSLSITSNGYNFLTYSMNKTLATQGKDTTKTFRKVTLKLSKYPGLMTEMIRWVLTTALDNKSKPTLSTSTIWLNNGKPDIHRRHLEYYADTLNCSYDASIDLSKFGTDGKIIGDPRWSFVDLGIVTTGVGDQVGSIPERFELVQNYPNPFNPSTQLKIHVAARGPVSVHVFDVLGRQVATLLDEIKDAGTYQLHWNAFSMPSGVYFYQMKAEGFVETKKMMLMK
jgi:hypothetical protein